MRICAPPHPAVFRPGGPLPGCLVRNQVRTHQGGFLLTTSVVLGTVAGDTPNKHVCMFSLDLDPACVNWLVQASQSLVGRMGASWVLARPALGLSLKKKKVPLPEAGKTEPTSLRPEWGSADAHFSPLVSPNRG